MYEQPASVPVDLVTFTDCFQEHTHTRLFVPAPFSCSSTKFKLKNCGRLGYSCTCACIYGLRIASTSGELRTIRTLDNSDLGQFGPDSDLSCGQFGPWSIRTLVNSDLDHWSIRTP